MDSSSSKPYENLEATFRPFAFGACCHAYLPTSHRVTFPRIHLPLSNSSSMNRATWQAESDPDLSPESCLACWTFRAMARQASAVALSMTFAGGLEQVFPGGMVPPGDKCRLAAAC